MKTSVDPSKVPVPVLLSRRPKAKNGYIIPFFVYQKPGDDSPDFRVMDFRKIMTHCIKQGKCSLCGEVIDGLYWFAGGPNCLEHHLFHDPPAHKECLRYAFRVCPFLVNPSAKYNDRPIDTTGGELLNFNHVAQRPEQLYAMAARTYQCLLDEAQSRMVLKVVEFSKIIPGEEFAALPHDRPGKAC